MDHNRTGRASEEDKTQRRASDHARVMQEREDLEIAIIESLRELQAREHLEIAINGDAGSHVGRCFMEGVAAQQPIGKHTCGKCDFNCPCRKCDLNCSCRKCDLNCSCRKCDLKCSSQTELTDHMDTRELTSDFGRMVQTNEREIQTKHPCAKCDNVFDSSYKALTHLAMHEKTWDYGWNAYRERNKGKIVSCKIDKCTRSFPTADELRDHVLRIHGMFSCSMNGCARHFGDADDAEYHVCHGH
jgi:hypothetical protein